MKDNAAKWLAAMQSPATSKAYTDGINAVTQSPTMLAAAPDAEQRYLQNTAESVNSGRRAAALQAVTLQAWQQITTSKGAQRLSTGATAAGPKMQSFFAKWNPIFANVSQTVRAMPKGGMANALARVQTTIQMLKQAAGKPVN